MRLNAYIKDKIFSIIIMLLTFFIITFFLVAFNVNKFLIVSILFFYLLSIILCFLHDYFKRKIFYDFVSKKLHEIDQKYLITELIKTPEFLDGEIFKECLYEVNKSYIESINQYKYSSEEFKEYIELWCHEIKIPIATAKLILENHSQKVSKELNLELNRIDSLVEQVLYYARSGNPEKDYIISRINLKDAVNNVIKRNKSDILNKKIKIVTFEDDVTVESDMKWLEFILNQIISNSIKYSKDLDAKINIKYLINKNNTMLFIEDNGIGIPSNEIDRVFEKGFTGSNGRKNYNSTGIGLYLCKKLCNKLGHNVSISSKVNEYTKITIIFPNSSLIDDLIKK